VAEPVTLSMPITTWLSTADRQLTSPDNGNVFGKFAYSQALKCIPFFNIPRSVQALDAVYAIRPRGV
jgi:hypothetical protein